MARLSRQLPYTFAAEVLLVGDRISAADAHRMGLVTRLVPSAEVAATAHALAARMAQNAPVAMRKAKEALLRCGGLPLSEAFRVETECAGFVLPTAHAK